MKTPYLILAFCLVGCVPPTSISPSLPGNPEVQITHISSCLEPTRTTCRVVGEEIDNPTWMTPIVVHGLVAYANRAQWMIEWESCRADVGGCVYMPPIGPWSPHTVRELKATVILRALERHWIILRAEIGDRFAVDTLEITPPLTILRKTD